MWARILCFPLANLQTRRRLPALAEADRTCVVSSSRASLSTAGLNCLPGYCGDEDCRRLQGSGGITSAGKSRRLETDPLLPKYPMSPHATDETFTPDIRYLLNSSFLIHTLMNTPTIFLLAINLYLPESLPSLQEETFHAKKGRFVVLSKLQFLPVSSKGDTHFLLHHPHIFEAWLIRTLTISERGFCRNLRGNDRLNREENPVDRRKTTRDGFLKINQENFLYYSPSKDNNIISRSSHREVEDILTAFACHEPRCPASPWTDGVIGSSEENVPGNLLSCLGSSVSGIGQGS
nr:hypothetical protein CRG98_023535 [Ipomoea batatas]